MHFVSVLPQRFEVAKCFALNHRTLGRHLQFALRIGGDIVRYFFGASLVLLTACLIYTPTTCAQQVTYTADNNIGDFTGQVSEYAVISNFNQSDANLSSPFTPTAAELAATGYWMWLGGALPGLAADNNWILATFSRAVSTILVFPSIDHPGLAYDGYQYSIYGSNDGVTWTPLFDALTVSGSGSTFTLASFVGTAPTSVNNIMTGGCTGGHCVGYEATFSFSKAYRLYAFGGSTEAINAGNSDQELSGVGAVLSVEEPLDGNALLQMCQQQVAWCEGYIEGVADLLMNFCAKRDDAGRGDDDDEAGTRDSHREHKEVGCRDCDSPPLCLPAGLDLSHLRAVVLAYLANHPDVLSRKATWIVVSALKGAYPCSAEDDLHSDRR